MPLAVALAVRKNGLTPNEAIVAGTWNAACVLGTQGEDATAMVAPVSPLIFNFLMESKKDASLGTGQRGASIGCDRRQGGPPTCRGHAAHREPIR